MSLTAVPRYDADQVTERGGHAVVLGAGMAGLLAARVLADSFATVTVIERDRVPDEPVVRDGVPQGEHAHLLLEAGRLVLEDLFPGYCEDIVRAGAVIVDASTDFHHYTEGDFLADGPELIPTYSATRPLFEHVAREHVLAGDAIELRDGCSFVDYRFDESDTAVVGVTVRTGGGATEDVSANLVVDATGRTSRTPELLTTRGYPQPSTDEVRVDMGYGTVLLERPPDQRHVVFVEATPPRRRGAVAFPVENGRRLVTLFGFHGDHPPTDADGLTAFAASLPVPHLARFFEEHSWVSDGVVGYRFPSNLRRHYSALDRFPDGLLVVGDAICSFNPVYGQGMTVAGLEALVLHHALAEGGRDGLALRFFERSETVVDVAWNTAVGGDFQFPQTEGRKPRGTDFTNWYLSRLVRRAHDDGELRDTFYRVLGMEEHPRSLLHPRVALRVFSPFG